MEVDENHKRLRVRTIAIITGPGLMIVAIAVLSYFQFLVIPLCYIGIVVSGLIIVRYCILVTLSKLDSSYQESNCSNLPSICLIIPCLNERPILEKTIPKMQSLIYCGSLYFCYIIESTSSDGTLQYIEKQAKSDNRIVVVIKKTPPAGRGAAIAYGLYNAPHTDVVAFLDSDHTMDQDSLITLSRIFGNSKKELVIQGMLQTHNNEKNILVRAQSVERNIIERLEIEANGKIGGFSFYGGGQGFFSRSLFEKHQFKIDESLLLDDIDLSFRLALGGYKVELRQDISTESLVPEKLTEFIDQRFGWSRGWLDLADRHISVSCTAKKIPILLRIDCLRFFSLPYIAPLFILFWSSGIVAMLLGVSTTILYFLLPILCWPLFCGLLMSIVDYKNRYFKHKIVISVDMALLFVINVFILSAVFIDKHVFRSPSKYLKTAKANE